MAMQTSPGMPIKAFRTIMAVVTATISPCRWVPMRRPTS
jgi:hypothetical protein